MNRLEQLKRSNAFKSLFLASAFAILGASFCFGGDIVVNNFAGLNTQDPPVSIQPNQSQDLLNVNLQPGGGAVFKRDGYGLFQTLTTVSTSAVHGGYHFQQTGGGDVQLWGADQYLYGSVNDATAVALATGTVNSTWQCTDNLGFAYCLSGTAGDTAVKTDGSKANTTFQGGIPLGTTVTSTPLQLVVAGVSGSPSTLNFSANNNFTNFATGPLPTDPFTEIINAPGSRITHVAYYFGKVFWWKDQSFGYLSGSASQNTVSLTIVSNQIGTLDNSSAFWNPTVYDGPNAFATGAQAVSSGNPYFNEAGTLGGIFFRGQDNHIYQYDGYTLTRLTRIISPTVTAANRKKANSWTQTSQSDFAGGASSQTVTISSTVSPGDVTVGTFTATDSTTANFSAGTKSNLTVANNSISLTTNNSGNVTNGTFESGDMTGWTNSGSQSWSAVGSDSSGGCTVSPNGGSWMTRGVGYGASAGTTLIATIEDLNGIALSTTTISVTEFSDGVRRCSSWTQSSISSSGLVGKRVRFRFQTRSATQTSPNSIMATNSSYILGGDISFWYATGHDSTLLDPAFVYIDDITGGSSTITTGSFASQGFDTGLVYSYVKPSATWTASTFTPSFVLQKGTSTTGGWTDVGTSTGVSYAVNQRYVRYLSTFTVGAADNALSSLSNVTLVAASSGTYYSAVDNAPNLTSWGFLSANDSATGNSSLNYFTRASTSIYTVSSATPAWVSQIKNTVVSASTGTYMQLRVDFNLTAATETPTLNDFTFNWYEGSAGDKAYITYFQDAIWFSVSSGTSTSKNNTILYLDLINNAWLKYDIAANGFSIENNALYFGDPSAGKIYKFGGVQTDNGSAITSYWKSKDFTGADPTVQNEFIQSDFIFNSVVSTVTYTYNLDQRVTTSVTLPLYGGASSLIKRGILLSPGKIGTFYNFQVGDSSSNAAWKLMGHRVHYTPLNWIPQSK